MADKVEMRREFYPQFCLLCSRNYISRLGSRDCPYCGSRNTVNHNRQLYFQVIGSDKNAKTEPPNRAIPI